MELLGERPAWSMSGGEALAALDTLDAEIARLQSCRLQLVARIDDIGHAQELGARDTVELLSFRYRLDRAEAYREVRLARALPKYGAVSAGLTRGIDIPAPRLADTETGDTDTENCKTDTAPDADSGTETETYADGDDAGDRETGAAPDAEGGAESETCAESGDVSGGGAGGGDGGGVVVRVLRSVQAQVIVSALERVRSRVPVEDLNVAEQQLVKLAAHLCPKELRAAATEICNLLDSDGPEPDEQKAYARESLTLASAENGVKFKGYLANENAELLRSLVHAGARPHKTIDGELDPRSRAKRQADALTTALTVAASVTDTGFTPPVAGSTSSTTGTPSSVSGSTSSTSGSPSSTGGSPTAPAAGPPVGRADAGTGVMPRDGRSGRGADGRADRDRSGRGVGERVPGSGAKATIMVTIDFEDLKAATADATGRLVYGDGLSAAAIRRLACDAKIIPLVLGSNSEPLDVGRTERLVTRAMRRALNARDRGCVVCGAPPIQCDAHHLRSWIDGGVTAVSNLALLCRRHHVDLHHGKWTITITDGVVQVSRPAWADPPPLPRRPRVTSLARSPLDAPATGDPGDATRSPDGDDRTRTAAGPPRTKRWAADPATLQEAARFALWGENPTKDPPPPDSAHELTQTTPADPWDDVALV